MNKEYLEALKILDYHNDLKKCWGKEFDIVEQALLELKEIKESNLSEALKELNEIVEYITEDKKVKYKVTILFDCDIIKDALLKAQEQEKEIDRLENQCLDILGDNIRLKNKAQEQEKVLEIIKEKRVNIEYLRQSHNVREYNSKITVIIDGIKYAKSEARKLTGEEFDILKRYFG